MTFFPIVIAVVVAVVFASWYLASGWWLRALTLLAHKRAGLESKQVVVDGIRWHYLRGGKGPNLLLIHGFGADTGCWIPLATSLSSDFNLLIPDLAGFGQSEPPKDLGFDISSQTKRLMAFLDAIGVDECLVAGNSMGGYVAASLAASDPARVRALWLLAPLGVRSVPPGKALEDIDSGQVIAGEVNSVRQFSSDFVDPLFSRWMWLPYPFMRAQAVSAMERQDQVPRMLAEVRFESEPLETIAKRIKQPVLIQWGDEDRILNPAGLAVMEREFCNCRACLTKKCGHLPMFERPRESARLFRDWLAQQNLNE